MNAFRRRRARYEWDGLTRLGEELSRLKIRPMVRMGRRRRDLNHPVRSDGVGKWKGEWQKSGCGKSAGGRKTIKMLSTAGSQWCGANGHKTEASARVGEEFETSRDFRFQTNEWENWVFYYFFVSFRGRLHPFISRKHFPERPVGGIPTHVHTCC